MVLIKIWGLGIGDWGLGVGGWGPTPNPQPPLPKPLIKTLWGLYF